MPAPHTASVSTRPPTAADLDEFITLTRRSRRFHAGWAAPPRNPEQYLAYLTRNRADDFDANLIIRTGDGAIVGAINLSQIFYGGFRNAYLGYWIGAPFARQGHMSEALPLVLDRAFASLRLHRVEANLQPTNIPSRQLVQRLGFRLEGYSPSYLKIGGRWRDHERWAILHREWTAHRRSLARASGP